MRICSLAGLPSGVADQIRVEQVNALSTLVGVMSVMGQGTVVLVLYEFWDIASHNVLGIASAVIALCYVVLTVLSLRWSLRRKAGVERDHEAVRRAFTRTCLVLSFAWGFLFVELMSHAHDDRRSLLYAVIIGLMSSGVLVAPASAAFSFWLPVTTAGFIAITFVSDARDFGGAVLLTGYASLTLFCLVYLNRALIRRVLGEIDQHEGRETIGLLLKDFEESACDWLWETNENGCLTYVSARLSQAAGTEVDLLHGTDLAAFLDARASPKALPVHSDRRRRTDLAVIMARRQPFRDVESSFEGPSGTIWWSLTGKPKFALGGSFEGYRGVGSDVTAAHIANDRARFLALYDELTGLANRRLFREVLESHFKDIAAPTMALLCLDLDRFKAVNDTLGHASGDALLAELAKRLQANVGPDAFCARLGGDEFAVILDNAADSGFATLAKFLVAELSRPYRIEGAQVEVGVSIGIALASPETSSAVAILRNADAALYQAKLDGRGITRLYDLELSDRDSRRRALQNELRGAIDRGELRLEFQPVFNLAQRRITAVEALVRWDSPKTGTFVAADFVSLAENCGLIDALGEWVLARACEEANLLPPDIRVAVNVSPLQLHGRRLVRHICQTLAASGFDPTRLELELTETAFFDMSRHTLELLQEVRALGISINLDDFGVGHTSLGQLRRFPFNAIKIDRSFVQDLPGNSSARAIVRGLTTMAADLGIRTIAEGIETSDQLDLVERAGCSDAQGFLLARPMPIEAVLALLGVAAEEEDNKGRAAALL